MSGSNALSVDIEGLRGAAATLRDGSATLRRQSRRVDDHAFGGSGEQAGRNYARQGSAVHSGFEHVADCLRNWGMALAATADVFDSAASEYQRLDRERAARISGG
ncbi:hypothetical protein [Nocardia huaxiensis]|uniref:Excreted virulence factor EspC (Type VII ESX diderm) n=1 Tax=Nocardia huaxiensis TaxID=2755382 RepID=A0A7D6ZP15_9NOCA|nr:hypothetical protein [Nocardia huaxiensis]QLY31923.1 hypothetical protein H0264_06365 [Nocardia huaxiensis]UFS95490.1 hypothetical protein LPY97_33245 [Nocardia huaxiensis]